MMRTRQPKPPPAVSRQPVKVTQTVQHCWAALRQNTRVLAANIEVSAVQICTALQVRGGACIARLKSA